MNKIKRIIRDPYYVVGRYLKKKHPRIMSDKYFLKVAWKQYMGKELDLKNPQSFNEKLQWLKLYNKHQLYTSLVDKEKAKKWIIQRIGESSVVPTLAVYNSVSEIDLDSLPDRFVLKCNHDCGSVLICRDKKTFDFEGAKKKLNDSMNKNYYWDSREWPYKHIKKCILAEEFIGDDLQDYRVYCFDGEPRLIYSYTNSSQDDGTKPEPSYCDIFDCSWNPMPFHQKSLPHGNVLPPQHLSEMIRYAKVLSKGFPFMRVDFYETDRPIVGELTFFPGGGFSAFYPIKWDYILGSWLSISTKQ